MPGSTREKIIDAAIDLFSQKGYAQTSIRDIAQTVQIKTSSIYYHFESKEAILNYILNKYIEVVSKSKHRRIWHENKEAIIADEAKLSANEIMNLMFFKLDGPQSTQYAKMVKIICSEAIRNDTVRDYFCHQNNDIFNYIKSILDCLLEAGKIKKCDTSKFSGILCSIPLAFMYLGSIDMRHIGNDNEYTGMFILLEYVLRFVAED